MLPCGQGGSVLAPGVPRNAAGPRPFAADRSLLRCSRPMEPTAVRLAAGIARAFRFHVVEECLPRIRSCVERLDEEQLWRRHGEKGNSVGNLCLHLEGNVRQWIVAGVGGRADARDRPAEFASGPQPRAQVLDRLEETAREAAGIVDGVDAD